MTNKELVEKLIKYFLTQNPEIVARILANCMIDLHRVHCLDLLLQNEKECLFSRLEHNSKELIDFAKNGLKKDLTYENIEF